MIGYIMLIWFFLFLYREVKKWICIFFLKLDDDLNDVCISEKEVIEGNLKKILLEVIDKSKFDFIIFFKLKEENIWRILKEELVKRRRIKFYLIL